MRISPGAPVIAQCFYRQTADETLGPWIPVLGCANVVFYITANGTTSSGVITIEECAPENMANTPFIPFGATTDAYSSVTTVNASTVSGDKQVALHITNANYFFLRARISTAIGGGGSISVGVNAS